MMVAHQRGVRLVGVSSVEAGAGVPASGEAMGWRYWCGFR